MKPSLFLALGLAALSPACAPPETNSPPERAPAIPPVPPAGEVPPARPGATPPPISGGTLLVALDGKTAVAVDPDRDRVFIVDLSSRQLLHTVTLQPGDEPGRLVEDGGRRVHVALRGAGALVTIDLDRGAVIDRRPVCGSPRGVAYDGARGAILVACATGELWSLPPLGGAGSRALSLGPDLRDIVVQGDRVFVSRLKSAQVIELDASLTGAPLRQLTPPEFTAMAVDMKGQVSNVHTRPVVAWRTVGLPTGGVVMVHMRALVEAIPSLPGGYGGGPCKGGIVNSTVSILDGTPRAPAAALIQVVLPVDLAISRGGTQVAVVDAARLPGQGMAPVSAGPLSGLSTDCAFLGGSMPPIGQLTAVAFDGQDRVVVQSREPAALYVLPSPTPINLSTESKRDAGHDLFHGTTMAAIACASCHPEAGEDGHVWTFAQSGARRTQTVRGGLLGTEPFHWSGDMADLRHLTEEVMTKRMVGPRLSLEQVTALGRFIDAQPRLPAPPALDPAAAARGQAIFADAQVGCASCHGGAKLTNNKNEDVGTGGPFQVPSLLGVAHRAPFLHSGCAGTLRDRFGACGGGDAHGKTSHLGPQQLDDLTAYLQTL